MLDDSLFLCHPKSRISSEIPKVWRYLQRSGLNVYAESLLIYNEKYAK